MLTLLFACVLAQPAAAWQQTDTTFAVRPDSRIEVESSSGRIAVATWDRDAVRVVASGADRGGIDIDVASRVVRIEPESRHGPPMHVDLQVTVPAAAALRVTGSFTDVSIDGARGEIYVETVRGDVDVRGGSELVSLRSVEGQVRLEQARGRIRVGSVNDGILLRDIVGEISAETVNGDVTLERIESGGVGASTVNGDIAYAGTIREGGRYTLSTHNGDISVTLPEDASATLSLATLNGEVRSEIPLPLTELRRGERFHVTLGTGSALVELESFNGTIHIRRARGASPASDSP